MTDCLNFEQQISAMLDGELPEAEHPALEAHLRTCDSCARAYRAFAGLSAALRELEAEPPADLKGWILSAVEASKITDLAAERKKRRPWRGLAAIAVCFAVILGVVVFAGPDRVQRSMPAGMLFTLPPEKAESAERTVPAQEDANEEAANRTGEGASDGEILGAAIPEPLSEAESEKVLALLTEPVEAEAPEAEAQPVCDAVSRTEDGDDSVTTLWIDGDDVIFTADGEHYFRTAGAAAQLLELLKTA